MAGSKHVFWQALVFTIVIFSIGLILGSFLESSRADKVELNLLRSEISLLDEQIRNRGLEQFDISCDLAKESTISFADNIYQEALKLEKYDATSKFSDALLTLHKRYDLLRMLLWIEGIDLKKNCNQDIHTVTYLFEYASDNTITEAKQASLSRLLADLKNKYGSEILLIPIAGNLDLESVNLIKRKYDISALPAIIIDEEKIISESVTLQDLELITFERKGFEALEGIAFRRSAISTLSDNDDTIFLN